MTTPQTRPSSTHLTGILSGTGRDTLRATVYIRSVPTHPPAELSEAVHPIHDNHGDLRDWRFGSLTSAQHLDDGTYKRFHTWRAGFAQDRFLGERALLRSFLDWLEPRCDTSTLGILRLPSGHVDFHAALKMKIQIEAADRAVAASHEDGVGLCSGEITRTAMRALIPTVSPTLLLGLNDTTLTIGLDGLSLQAPETEATLQVVNGWRAATNSLIALGDGREVDVTGLDAEKLLRLAGRQAPLIGVHDAPLRTLMAPVLVFLRDAATLAGSTCADLHFRSGWS